MATLVFPDLVKKIGNEGFNFRYTFHFIAFWFILLNLTHCSFIMIS